MSDLAEPLPGVTPARTQHPATGYVLYLVAAIGLSLSPGPNGLLALTHGGTEGAHLEEETVVLDPGAQGFQVVHIQAIGRAGNVDQHALEVLEHGGQLRVAVGGGGFAIQAV